MHRHTVTLPAACYGSSMPLATCLCRLRLKGYQDLISAVSVHLIASRVHSVIRALLCLEHRDDVPFPDSGAACRQSALAANNRNRFVFFDSLHLDTATRYPMPPRINLPSRKEIATACRHHLTCLQQTLNSAATAKFDALCVPLSALTVLPPAGYPVKMRLG